MINKLKRKFAEINSKILEINSEIQNNKGLIQIGNIIGENSYIPFTDSSLNFSSLSVLFNDIVINQRKTIVEFGSGTSTILLAKLLHLNKIDGKIISFEHDINWLSFIKTELSKNAVENYVDLIHLELSAKNQLKENCLWYDNEKLYKVLEMNDTIDCVLVDGPPAYLKEIENSRYPALPSIYKFLSQNFSLFLDDTNRASENESIRLWKKEFEEINIEKFNESFTGIFRGDYFNIRLPRVNI